MRYDPDMDIQYVKLVGEKRARLFHKLDVYTVGQLLSLFPRKYIDYSHPLKIKEAVPGEANCIKAVVDRAPVGQLVRKGMTVYKTAATDGENILEIVIFNNRYLAEALRQGEEYYFYGKVEFLSGRARMDSPIVEKGNMPPCLKPVYPLTAGLTSKGIGAVMKNALALFENGGDEETLREEMRREYGLCSRRFAYRNIHFPSCAEDIEAARKRLIFEELLCLQLGMDRLRGAKERSGFTVKEDMSGVFFSSLPFTPTPAQRRATDECIRDMKSGCRMNRLLQGDVGSGKTAVAAAVMFSAVKSGFQCAMMAPTEILSSQHLHSLKGFFEPFGIRTELLTASTPAKEKRRIKQSLLTGETDIVVGTHALLQSDVRFSSLGLVITDEQHRFGVRQRGTLSEKGEKPHILVMSATPIPRTLAMTVYGDLDISVLDSRPAGRQETATYCVNSSYRSRIYSFIKKHLDRGLQAYIVCPLVSDGEETGTVSAQEYYAALQSGEFRSYRVGLLHGKMKSAEKEQTMLDFSSGKIQLLVCTTVIEVGVDVPNAAVMLIENAERFGLSQLHQLRGRVGRGKEKATCVLITDSAGPLTKKRGEILCQTNDGFKIADADLSLRGPGDFFGSRQHGLPPLQIADMLHNTELLTAARLAADEILSRDPLLSEKEHSSLKEETERMFSGAAAV